jgi:hypothetical protein
MYGQLLHNFIRTWAIGFAWTAVIVAGGFAAHWLIGKYLEDL